MIIVVIIVQDIWETNRAVAMNLVSHCWTTIFKSLFVMAEKQNKNKKVVSCNQTLVTT